MNRDPIALDPEHLEFGDDSKQLIKVTNKTSDTLDNCFFCMFNTSKYQFSPEAFTLNPHEQKLITVTLKLKPSTSYSKEFAYLKTLNINKRIIIHNNPPNYSDQKFMSPQSGAEDLHTLSSRDYRETQKTAYEKVIAEKEAYIKRLERKIEEQEDSVKKVRAYGTEEKSKNFYINEIEELEIKIDIINQEKQKLMKENILQRQKFDELKVLTNSDAKYEQMASKIEQADQQIQKQQQEIQFLEAQCEEFLHKISQKETIIHEMQEHTSSIAQQLARGNDERLKVLERKIEEQRSESEKSSRMYEQKIRDLEASGVESRLFKSKVADFEKDIEKKRGEIEKLERKLREEEKNRKEFEEERKKMMKLQLVNSSLEDRNGELNSRVKELEKSVEQLKEQTIIYKSKISDNDQSSDKVGHYLEVALESCRNENQILKKNRKELENSVAELTKSRVAYENRIEGFKGEIKQLQDQIGLLQEQRDELENRSRLSKQESHDAIMKLKSENIDLIEKINLGGRKDELASSQARLAKIEEELEESRVNERELGRKLSEAEESKEKLMKKIERYKKEAKKELKSIEDNVLDELKKVRVEKKRLSKKVEELEQSVNSETADQTRNKTKTHYDTPNIYNGKTRCPLSQQGEKRVGIRDQRRELEESHANSRQAIDYEGLYSELGELREFKNYVNKEMGRFGVNLGMSGLCDESSSIFQAINFFKQLEAKLNEKLSEDSKINEAQRQIEFLKGRLTELESLRKETNQQAGEHSSIDFPHDKTLLEYVRQEMKNQYKKQYDALKLNEEKYEILKKKVFEEYRSRLIDLLSKKDRDERTLGKVEATLERFIEGLSNMSHKEAVLAKEIKLKQAARKEAGALREKVNNLNMLLQNKKGYCTREPVKILNCQNQNQWYDNIRLEAQLLTYQAQNSRLLEQVAYLESRSKEIEQELICSAGELDAKTEEIMQLKKEVLKLDREREEDMERNRNQIESLRAKFVDFQRSESDGNMSAAKNREFMQMKDDLQRKKENAKELRDKIKMLEELLSESQRECERVKSTDRRQNENNIRMQESLRELKDGNKELRSQNNRLREANEKLVVELEKKNSAIKRLSSEKDEHRIKAPRVDKEESDKLRSQARDLKDEIRKLKEQLQKIKRKKDNQIQQLSSQIDRSRNQAAIQKGSLESIIRALIETIKRVYSELDSLARRKTIHHAQSPDFEELEAHPGEIDAIRVYQSFSELLQLLRPSNT